MYLLFKYRLLYFNYIDICIYLYFEYKYLYFKYRYK